MQTRLVTSQVDAVKSAIIEYTIVKRGSNTEEHSAGSMQARIDVVVNNTKNELYHAIAFMNSLSWFRE